MLDHESNERNYGDERRTTDDGGHAILRALQLDMERLYQSRKPTVNEE